MIPVHQHPQGAGGGNLLRLHEITGNILGDLAAHQVHGAHIGLLHVQVLDDGDGALAAHGAAYVQLAVVPQGQVHLGIGHIAPDVALGVGHRQHRAQRAAALDLQGQAGPLALQGVAHHGRAGQGPAQGRRGHRAGVMDLTGPLGKLPAADGRSLHQAVGGNRSYNIIAHAYKTSFICECR